MSYDKPVMYIDTAFPRLLLQKEMHSTVLDTDLESQL